MHKHIHTLNRMSREDGGVTHEGIMRVSPRLIQAPHLLQPRGTLPGSFGGRSHRTPKHFQKREPRDTLGLSLGLTGRGLGPAQQRSRWGMGVGRFHGTQRPPPSPFPQRSLRPPGSAPDFSVANSFFWTVWRPGLAGGMSLVC